MGFDLEKVLQESGALIEGHFLLSSGKHSDRYVEKFHLLRRPSYLQQICAEMVRRLQGVPIDVVAGPTTGGILIAAEVARQIGVRAAYAEREDAGSAQRAFRRVNYFEPGDRVLVVDDIMTTGGSVSETIAALTDHPVELAAVMVMVDRSMGRTDLGVRYESLAEMDIPSWDPEQCPLCRECIPLVKPGTTGSAVGR